MCKELQKELAALKSKKLVSSRPIGQTVPTTVDVINVGITFRTDSSGRVHLEHDRAAIQGMNNMTAQGGRPLFPFRIVPVTLPRGASGADTPARVAQWEDLDDIHLLYIPGAPTANDTQEASSADPVLAAEEQSFNRLEAPVRRPKEKERDFLARTDKYLRMNGEHVSRAAYELRLLGIARNRGIPILAVCAGSWRLLESYGGKVRTLEIAQRAHHKAANPDETWNIENSIRLVGAKTLIELMFAKGRDANVVRGVNSTHWAVASTFVTTPAITLTTPEGHTSTLVKQGLGLARGAGNPSDMLEVTAVDVDTDTVEAFESLYGSPTMGIQWHPEGYLPGMPGELSGSEEAQVISKALFEFMGFAARTAKQRANLSVELNRESCAFKLLCDCARYTAEDKDVSAGNAYRGATQILPSPHWSARLVEIDEVITLLYEYRKEVAARKMVAAGNLYRDAQQKLRKYGVTV
jgi:hypothetical protein